MILYSVLESVMMWFLYLGVMLIAGTCGGAV